MRSSTHTFDMLGGARLRFQILPGLDLGHGRPLRVSEGNQDAHGNAISPARKEATS